MTKALAAANGTVFALAGRQPEFRGMGTTLVAALIKGGEATVLNVGDSRAYRVRRRKASARSARTTPMWRRCAARASITEADARTHPQKNLITRAVGVDSDVEGDLFEVRLAPKDILLLCSDGLCGMVGGRPHGRDAPHAQRRSQLAGDALLNLALEAGGRDNITVALFTRGAEAGRRDRLMDKYIGKLLGGRYRDHRRGRRRRHGRRLPRAGYRARAAMSPSRYSRTSSQRTRTSARRFSIESQRGRQAQPPQYRFRV